MSGLGDLLHRHAFRALSVVGRRSHHTLLRRYFDWWHRRPDPWGLDTSADEHSKYAQTFDHVPAGDYRTILDLGCSEGTFTALAAEAYPAAQVTGVDISERAVERAAERHERARFQVLDVLDRPLDARFDLLFCSEMLYYLGRDDNVRLAVSRMRDMLEPSGILVAVHPWPDARRLHAHLDEHAELAQRSLCVHKAGDLVFELGVYEAKPA